jgi:plasmid stabilization system protein ParE
MRRPYLTEKAREDLQDIHRYTLSAHGEEQATLYLAGLREKLNLLAAIPGMSPRERPFPRSQRRETSHGHFLGFHGAVSRETVT